MFLGCAGVVVALILFVGNAIQDVEGVGVFVDGPADVVVGQTFDLIVTVTNERPRKVLALSDIDIGEEYLAGFIITNINPRPKSSMHVAIDNSRSFTFSSSIPPKMSKSFTFTLRALNTGLYRGDVDICEGSRFITGMAQTSVTEKEKSGEP